MSEASSAPSAAHTGMLRLQETLQHSMSSHDLKRQSPHTRVCTYKEFEGFENIDALLGPGGSCIFLYETRPNYGHWCAVFARTHKGKKAVEVFDPYGVIPDDELKLVSKAERQRLGQSYPHLTRLLYECPYHVEYNNHALQKICKSVNTCGRHCLVRIAFRDMDIDEYARKMKSHPRFSPDEIVALALPYVGSSVQTAAPLSHVMGGVLRSDYNFLRSHMM